ncbi:MAG: potassium-transporting ATPase subunit KdpA [Gammaproteobacteria bacterium]
MSANSLIQLAVLIGAVLLLSWPVGLYLARVFMDKTEQPPSGGRIIRALRVIENSIYRMAGVDPLQEMDWVSYAVALLVFNLLGAILLYAILRLQYWLPLNPQHFPAVPSVMSFNTAVSFMTNTNWQSYSGETTLGIFSQMFGLTVQNFLSAATGLCIAIVLIRAFARESQKYLGNFWVDLTRATLYVLLPFSLVVAVFLISQGVIQNFQGTKRVDLLHPVAFTVNHHRIQLTHQVLPMGPVASQEAIKELGNNGGGYFNMNSAHPFENPNPLSNFLEMICMFLFPGAICIAFGEMVGDRRQGWAILTAMTILFVVFASGGLMAEHGSNPGLHGLPVATRASPLQSGGNMEGKETRFGITDSVLFNATATATSTGAINSTSDSYLPLGGLVPLWLMELGEVSYGGIGSGFYGMMLFVLVAVFVAGLMVGRTPEYLGKKIETFDMKMVALGILVTPAIILIGTAVAVLIPHATSVLGNPGPHGFTEILYAFSSVANNNGSAMGGLTVTSIFYQMVTGIVMLMGRFWFALPVMALSGSLVMKKKIPPSLGTLPTHTPLFITLLIGTVLLVGALNFLPALSLGPLIEHFLLIHSH